MAYENIIVETKGHVGLITLNRPKAYQSGIVSEVTQKMDFTI